MLSIKPYNQDPTGTILLKMKELLLGQMRNLRKDGVASEAVYRLLTHHNGNYGIAFIGIDGFTDPYLNEVLYAHSKVGNPKGVLKSFLTHGIKFTPLGLATQKFETLWVNSHEGIEHLYNGTGKPTSQVEEDDAAKKGFFNRNVCSESKILEYINMKIEGNLDVTGTIRMFTEKQPCLSCQGVLNHFVDVYNNLNVTVYYER